MPRYFFTLHDHVVEQDDAGTELPDLSAARLEAIRFAGEVLRDTPTLLDDGRRMQVDVTDDGSTLLFSVDIRAVSPD